MLVMTRCPEECGKKWRTGRQIKPGWQKRKEKEEKKEEFKRLTTDEEMVIAKIVEENEDLIELRMVEGMVP